MMVAPRSFACMTKRYVIGWFSAMLTPMITMHCELATSHWWVVAAPRPKLVPRPGTLLLCHMRAWFSIHTIPRLPPNNFLIR